MPALSPGAEQHASVDIVIPVLNEERALPGCVRTLHAYLTESFPYPWRITIIDNGSVDATWELATELEATLPAVFARRLNIRGRGAALRTGWLESPAEIVAYMDVDLSTGLDALTPLIAPLATGHSSIAIGTRLGYGARVHRGLKRELISRAYNLLLRRGMGASVTDAQCGFKAARAEVARPLVEKVSDDGFFFDTELLLLAEYNGVRVHEVPVDWVEDVDSRVNVRRTASADLRGVARVAYEIAVGKARVDLPLRPSLAPVHPDATLAPRQSRVESLSKILTFTVTGLLSTALFVAIYLVLRHVWVPALADLVALAVTSVANTEANRKWTFARTAEGRPAGSRIRQHYRAGILFFLYYASTTGAVSLLRFLFPGANKVAELAAILVVAITLTTFRYIALDRWAFARETR